MIKEAVGPVLAAILAMVVANCNTGCIPVATANQSHTMRILECVQKSATKDESVECRRKVNREHGLCTQIPRVEPC